MFYVYQVLYIQAFVLVFLLGKFMRKVFFGQLRAAEMEVNDVLLCGIGLSISFFTYHHHHHHFFGHSEL